MKDKQGREYLNINDAKHGLIVDLDDDFTCIQSNRVMLLKDNKGCYFECSEGKHYIVGQCDGGEYCIGIYPVENN
jgi:hypothetical protein